MHFLLAIQSKSRKSPSPTAHPITSPHTSPPTLNTQLSDSRSSPHEPLVEHEFETTGSNRAQTLPAFHEGAFLRRTFVDQVKTGTTNFLSNFKSVSNPPDRFNILRFCRIKLDLLPDLLNMHRNRSNISHRLHIPDFPE